MQLENDLYAAPREQTTGVTSEYDCEDKVNKHTGTNLLSAELTLEAGFKQKRTS